MISQDTIVAIATPPGEGAIGIVRISGKDAFKIAEKIIRTDNPEKYFRRGYKLRYVKMYSFEQELLDEGLMAVFLAPKSYTKENSVEFYCHGSPYILQELVKTALHYGARLAEPGEFTMRAFRNGAFDLAQAEAVAKLISARNKKAHEVALKQLKGNISDKLRQLRQELIRLASLLELELDFSEEDVEFANRKELEKLTEKIITEVKRLLESFSAGNALKEGIPIAIIGKPNVGKSTLLNRLLEENRAIVSEIPGTTRDLIEEKILLGGYEFRLIDTAGIRKNTNDPIEQEGIKRSFQALRKAMLVLFLFDASRETFEQARQELREWELPENTKVLFLGNKIDLDSKREHSTNKDLLYISAKQELGIDALKKYLVQFAENTFAYDIILTNARHYEALQEALQALSEVRKGLQENIYRELLTLDLRVALDAIGGITGEITTDTLLTEIFSNFCIGK